MSSTANNSRASGQDTIDYMTKKALRMYFSKMKERRIDVNYIDIESIAAEDETMRDKNIICAEFQLEAINPQAVKNGNSNKFRYNAVFCFNARDKIVEVYAPGNLSVDFPLRNVSWLDDDFKRKVREYRERKDLGGNVSQSDVGEQGTPPMYVVSGK